VNAAVGNSAQAGNGVGWQGMTIKDILEKVDLFNLTSFPDNNQDDEKKLKDIKSNLTMPSGHLDEKTKATAPATNSAFLGPKIWKKPLNFYKVNGGESDVGGFNASRSNEQGPQFSSMSIDEFLTENNFDIGPVSPPMAEDLFSQGGVEGDASPYTDEMERPFSLDDIEMDSERPIESPGSSMDMPDSPISGFEMRGGQVERRQVNLKPSAYLEKPKSESAKGGNDFLYVESKRARMEREKEERRRREEIALEFSAEDLALATVPGADFDPTLRHFSKEELRPQPIIRKRKKAYVDLGLKDDKYWEKRGKNNIAARRSREARRLKENQIALRTAFLEKQNNGLKQALQTINMKNEKLELEKRLLREKLEKYESMAAFLN